MAAEPITPARCDFAIRPSRPLCIGVVIVLSLAAAAVADDPLDDEFEENGPLPEQEVQIAGATPYV